MASTNGRAGPTARSHQTVADLCIRGNFWNVVPTGLAARTHRLIAGRLIVGQPIPERATLG